jgi:DNA-binding MarR family transcriptional regulator
MSTRFTSRGTPMADSQSLRLVFATAAVHERIVERVAAGLMREGYDVSPSKLHFLGALDCGVNYGADIARQLRVSRQMVAKTVKELCRAGYLEQVTAAGRQKQILFTAEGERLMSDIRQRLARLDVVLSERVGATAFEATLSSLDAIATVLTAGDSDAR